MSLLVEMKFITYYAAARHGLQRAGGEGGGRNRMERNRKEWPRYILFASITHKLQELPFGPFGLRGSRPPAPQPPGQGVRGAALPDGGRPSGHFAEGVTAPRVPPPFSVAAVPRALFNVAGDI